MPKTLSFSFVLIAFAIGYLAYSILAISQELSKTRHQLPYFFDRMESLEKSIHIESWLELSKQLEKQVPQVLDEVTQVRKTITAVNNNLPDILAESKALREATVPQLLGEIKAIRVQTTPPVLEEIHMLRTDTIPSLLAEVHSVNKQIIHPVLSEITAVRKEAPLLIGRMEQLVADVESASAKASKGAVKGIITSPLSILEDSGEFIFSSAESLVGSKKN
ncbi:MULTISPECIES: hypothetical protein [Pseudoalteromonas]|uniref:Uncharacterized protein n=1 Tax=Pseudoalteromonas undina TaxID=43660 RepID=A0ACC6R3D7_9GAMM|nr:hypothetical protein [Pseudoalteromonas sp. P1-25]KPZ56803.1 hypothetical protein AN393_00967 [Pseudoalteromonas sp. P1-25]